MIYCPWGTTALDEYNEHNMQNVSKKIQQPSMKKKEVCAITIESKKQSP